MYTFVQWIFNNLQSGKVNLKVLTCKLEKHHKNFIEHPDKQFRFMNIFEPLKVYQITIGMLITGVLQISFLLTSHPAFQLEA